MAFTGVAMQERAMREGVTAAQNARPPLSEAGHIGVVESHFVVDAPDLPSRRSQAKTQFGFFTSNHILTISADSLQRDCSDHHIAPAGLRLARWTLPLAVTEPIIN